MKYKNIVKAKFIERPNRFIAFCEIDGEIQKVHVKNTGRCKELLINGVAVYLEKSDNISRKTAYDLIAVEKGNLLINMDSQAPNYIGKEAIENGVIKIDLDYDFIKKEVTMGNSRFDLGFYKESNLVGLLEIKGVTLENCGEVMFPDAPTERGIKHIKELIYLKEKGIYTGMLFIIQLEGATKFSPNNITAPQFGIALNEAWQKGVNIMAYGCKVLPQEIYADYNVEISL